jgi:replicative DNA helicase
MTPMANTNSLQYAGDCLTPPVTNMPIDADAVSTGFVDLDSLLGGLHSGDLILVADFGVYKDMAWIFALHMALSAASEGASVGVVSAVESEVRLSHRLLAIQRGMHPFHIRSWMGRDQDIGNAVENLRRLRILLRSPRLSDQMDLYDVIQSHNRRLLVIDCSMQGSCKNRKMEVRSLRRLGRLARATGQSVIAVVASDLLDSVQSEVAMGILGDRDEDTKDSWADVHVTRNWHGYDGSVTLGWNGLTGALSDREREEG